MQLLAADELPAVSVERPHGNSDFLLACDHAGRRIPRALGTLGLTEPQLRSHIAWDIGTAGMASALSRHLDATLVLQNYSRLVIDCNRPLSAPDSIVLESEAVQVHANAGLQQDDIAARRREIFLPYHSALRGILDARAADAQRGPTLLISVHSFTPSFLGTPRRWHIGVMYNRDARLAQALLALLRRDKDLQVGENEPYTVDDETDYTVPVHGEARGIPHVLLETRQDLIADPAGQEHWAGRWAVLLAQAREMLI